MMSEVEMNPIRSNDECHSLDNLILEIEQGIVTLSNNNSNIIKDMETTKYSATKNDTHSSSAGDSLLPLLYQPQNDKYLHGWNALRTNIFWLRITIALLSLLSISLMASVEFVNYSKYYPFNYFPEKCDSFHLSGWFDMRPYQLVIADGVLLYVYCFLFALYYLLPENKDNRKFIPGFDKMLGYCYRDPVDIQDCSIEFALFCKSTSKIVELTLDSLLLLLTVLSFLIAAIYLERSTRFEKNNDVEYYSLGSFYSTFSHTNPICVDQDPTSLMRASLAMLFFAMALLAICLQISIQAVRYDWNSRLPPTSKGGGKMMEYGQEFRSLPLNTLDDDDPEAGYGGEEYYYDSKNSNKQLSYNDISRGIISNTESSDNIHYDKTYSNSNNVSRRSSVDESAEAFHDQQRQEMKQIYEEYIASSVDLEEHNDGKVVGDDNSNRINE